MRLPWFPAVISGLLLFLALPAGDPVASEKPPAPPTRSAFEADATGWTDLLADKDLKDWKRVSSKLGKRNPWRYEPKEKMLICDGAARQGEEEFHEKLLFSKEFADGIFHLEWRFQKSAGRQDYNSGAYVRTSADGKIWHQAQIGKKIGYIFCNSNLDGPRLESDRNIPQRGKPIGEWNTFEITCKGKHLILWVNGAVTGQLDIDRAAGYIGLECKHFDIEFRNLKFRELK